MVSPAGSQTAPVARPKRVRPWPFVSMNLPPAAIAEWNALAASLGRPRADLWREVLEQVGLPYARGLERAHARTGRGRSPPLPAPEA